MFQDHYQPLVVAYLVGLGGWLLASLWLPEVWPRKPAERIERPWMEVGSALVGAIGIIAMGQLWSRGIRLPEQGALGPLLGSINQLLIFAPILLVLVIRHQPLTSVASSTPDCDADRGGGRAGESRCCRIFTSAGRS